MPEGALVTGGGSGIGLACARLLSELGHQVALVGRDREKLEAAATECPGALALQADVASREEVAAAVRRAVEAFGGLDVAVVSAGVFPSRERLDEVSDSSWRDTLAINLDGAFHTLAEVVPHLRERGGYVFAIGSIYANGGLRLGAPYAASKAGLAGLVHTLIQEWEEHQVRATLISPGVVRTGMVGDGRRDDHGLLSPDDVAHAVRFCLGLSGAALVREIVLERAEVARNDRDVQEDPARWSS
ncbi:MAG: hypothetical protein V7607_108 [Solirubrobacteraceae bacterium]